MPIRDALLPEFDQEMSKTRQMLERVPEDKFAWKPHEKSMTLGRLASHIAELPGWAVPTLTQTELDLMPPGAPPYQPRTAPSRKELLQEFDANVAKARQAIQAASDPDFMAPWSLFVAGEKKFTFPRIAVVRGMMMNHLIHHRGQLTVYFRLNDVPVPSIYGPSADDPGM